MKCIRCDTEFGEGVKSCPNCGNSEALSLFKDVVDDGKLRNGKIALALVMSAIICLVVVFFSAGSGRKQTDSNDSGGIPDNSGSTLPSTPTSFPELHFTSSGHLPTRLHGLRLGMSVADAMDEDPMLKDDHSDSASGSASPASDPDAVLSRGSEESGFFETASFSHGRLTYISSTVSDISPDDASLFDRDTFVQLGKPDIEVYAGPSAKAWVWIDGDVRIRYDNEPVGTVFGSRTVSLNMVIYSQLIKDLTSERNKPNGDPSHWDAEANLELNKHEFGEDEGDVTLKQLPPGFSDIQLRMTASQVRAALPGIDLVRISGSQQQGELDAQNVHTDVTLWNGVVSFVGRTWDQVPANQIPEMRRNLMEEFGTPSAHVLPAANQFESITWEDKQTEVTYIFSVLGSDNSHQVQSFYYDKQLKALSQAADAAEHPQKFKPAPEAHSFL